MELIRRSVRLDHRQANEKNRTVNATLSSEHPVARFDGEEILEHTETAIDLSRTEGGLPLLFAHDQTKPIGVVESVRIVGRKLKGVLRFAKNAHADEIFRDVLDGVLKNLSIGYSIQTAEDFPGGYKATRWQPYEASIVTVPADPSVGVGRSQKEQNMENENATKPELKVVNEAQWQKRELERREAVRSLFYPFGDRYREIMDTALDNPQCGIEQVREMLLIEVGKGIEPINSPTQADQFGAGARAGGGFTRAAVPGRDNLSDFIEAAIDALCVRHGVPVNEPSPAARDLRNMGAVDMAEICLRQRGVSTAGMSRHQIITRSLVSHGSSDFSNLLSNVAGKALQAGFENEPASHKQWVKESEVADFKEQSRPAISEAPGLDLLYENGEIKFGTMSDRAETFSLNTYAKLFSISRQAIVNDDLGAFTRLPQSFGASGRRKEADLVYAVLTANPTMSDGTALFHADHSNLTASGTALSVASLGVARAAMRAQTGLGGSAILNIIPRYLIVPAALETTAEQLIASLVDPSKSNDTPNLEFIRGLELVVDARLDSDSATAWYLAANSQQVDTVEMVYLEGNRGISYSESESVTQDGLTIRATLDFATAAIDWRGLYKNPGA